MRTFARRLAVVACLATAAAILVSDVAWGRPAQATPRHNGIDVVKVDGLLDPPTASLVRDAIQRANQRRSTMIVLQLDSGGSVDVDVEPLLRDVRASRVPVVVWVGPSGAKMNRGREAAAEAIEMASLMRTMRGDLAESAGRRTVLRRRA